VRVAQRVRLDIRLHAPVLVVRDRRPGPGENSISYSSPPEPLSWVITVAVSGLGIDAPSPRTPAKGKTMKPDPFYASLTPFTLPFYAFQGVDSSARARDGRSPLWRMLKLCGSVRSASGYSWGILVSVPLWSRR
jgi:hypothetical protein